LKFHLPDVISNQQIRRPTTHKGFSSDEKDEAEIYGEAEKQGERGEDCDLIYPECKTSFVERMTYFESNSSTK